MNGPDHWNDYSMGKLNIYGNKKNDSYNRLNQRRGNEQTECNGEREWFAASSGPEYDQIQNQADGNVYDADAGGQPFADEPEDNGNHAAFAQRKNNSEQAAKPCSHNRVARRPLPYPPDMGTLPLIHLSRMDYANFRIDRWR